jgi:signal peptidase II
MLFYLAAFSITIADQIIKFLVVKYMYIGQSIPFLGKLLKLTHIRNTGAAFSFFVGFSPYLMIVGLITITAVIYFHYRLPKKDRLAQIALAFVLGGSLGNLIDRIFRHSVIDYLDISFWPVFNLADIMINVGVILLILKLISKEKADVSGTA